MMVVVGGLLWFFGRGGSVIGGFVGVGAWLVEGGRSRVEV